MSKVYLVVLTILTVLFIPLGQWGPPIYFFYSAFREGSDGADALLSPIVLMILAVDGLAAFAVCWVLVWAISGIRIRQTRFKALAGLLFVPLLISFVPVPGFGTAWSNMKDDREQKKHGAGMDADRSQIDSLDRSGYEQEAEGRYAEAEASYRNRLALQEKHRGDILGQETDIAKSLSALAGVLSAQGKYEEAETKARAAVAEVEAYNRKYSFRNLDLLWSLKALAEVLYAGGKYAEAESRAREALSEAEREWGPGPSHQAALIVDIVAKCLRAQNKIPEAAVEFDRATAASYSPEIMIELADLYRREGEHSKALSLAEKALVAQETLHIRQDHPTSVRILRVLGTLHSDLGNVEKSEEYLKRARDITTSGSR